MSWWERITNERVLRRTKNGHEWGVTEGNRDEVEHEVN